MIQITPLLRKLKEEGHHVTVYATENGSLMMRHNPNVDKIVIHKGSTDNEHIDALEEELKKNYDRVINLSGSVEGSLLVIQGSPEAEKSKEELHKRCDVNYTWNITGLAGYEYNGESCEMFFSPAEESEIRRLRRKYHDKFVILWSLSGSAFHKSYPYAEMVAEKFLSVHKDAVIMTVGDLFCDFAAFQFRKKDQYRDYSGIWPIRKSLLMTKYADLVIGPETGVLNAAGCYDTPKIIFMSHSSEENLTKYWKNVYPLKAFTVDCQPCHKLIYTLDGCPVEPGINSPLCMARITPKLVFQTMEEIYQKWRNDKWERSTLGRGASMRRTEYCGTVRESRHDLTP